MSGHPLRYNPPAPGKRARIFFFSHAANAWIEAGDAIAAAFAPASFEYDDKIDFLTCKRIDMTDAEFSALDAIDSTKRKPR